MPYLSPNYYTRDYEYLYDLSKYSQYSKYKGHNIMLRDDEDLGHLTFGNFFFIEGSAPPIGHLPSHMCLIGSVWIPLPKHIGVISVSGSKNEPNKVRTKDLPEYYSQAIKRLVDSYLGEHLTLCVNLGIVEVTMPKEAIAFFKEYDKAKLKTFIDVTTITDEERKILRSCYNHPWTYQERNDFRPDTSMPYGVVYNGSPIELSRGATKPYIYWADEDGETHESGRPDGDDY